MIVEDAGVYSTILSDVNGDGPVRCEEGLKSVRL